MKRSFISLRTRIFVIFLCLAVLVISVAAVCILMVMRRSNDILNQEILTNLQVNAMLIEKELKSIEDVSFQIFQDRTIQKLLVQIKNVLNANVDKYAMRQTRNSIEEILSENLYQKSYIQSITLYDTLGNNYTVLRSAAQLPDGTNSITDSKNIDPSGRPRWIAEEPYLYVTRQIRQIEGLTLDHIGVLLMKINMEQFERLFLASGHPRQIFILDEQKNPVYGNMPEWLTAFDFEEDSGHQLFHDGTNTYLFFYQKSAASKLIYIDCLNYTSTQQSVNMIIRTAAFIILLTFFIVLIISSKLLKKTIQPLSWLAKSMSSMDHLDIEQFAEKHRVKIFKNEIDILYNDFLKALKQIDALNKIEYEQKREMDKTLFLALQSQIKPHFIYNTLDTMNWIAKKDENTMLSQMLEALGDYLRYITNIRETAVSLREELEATKSYIMIEKIRFADRLIVDFQVEPALLGLKIPKMILQPLIENCIKHCLEKMMYPCHIKISVYAEGQWAMLLIGDNGPGIPAEAIEAITTGKYGNAHRGVGLFNIIQRLKQYAGCDQVFKIESVEGMGTTITICIPMSQQGEGRQDL